jgi:hypothetical protein
MMEQAHNPDLMIVERYFLGELTNDEAEAFEAHYFDCGKCAAYVVEELALIRSGQEVAKEAPANVVPIASRRRWQWLPAAAAAMLVVAVGVPTLMRDPAKPTVDVIAPTRIQVSLDRAAAAPPTRIFPEGSPIAFDVEIPAEDFPRFVVSIRDKSNELVDKEHELTAEQTTEPVLLVPSALPAGTYNVVIEGVREDGNRSPIHTKTFEVRGGSR